MIRNVPFFSESFFYEPSNAVDDRYPDQQYQDTEEYSLRQYLDEVPPPSAYREDF